MLGVVLIPSRGHYRADANALMFVMSAFVVWLAWDLWRPTLLRKVTPRVLESGIALVLFAFAMSRVIDSRVIANPARSVLLIRVVCGVQAALVATYFFDRGRKSSSWPVWRFWSLVALTALFGVLAIHVVPIPPIDVWTVQTEGVRALLAGTNPFEVVQVHETAPNTNADNVPYVYPPFHLFLTVPAYLLGDVRYVIVASFVVAGIALRFIARKAGRDLPAVLLEAPALAVMLTPKGPYLHEQAWIDPVQVACIALGAALAVSRRWWLAAIAFGFAVAGKQTMMWVAPMAFFAFEGFRIRHGIALAIAGAGPHALFAVWNWRALVWDNFSYIKQLPPREDALSFANFATRGLGVHGFPYFVAFPVGALLTAILCAHCRKKPHALGAALVVTYLPFYSLNKQMFANYYFTLAGMAAVGAALALHAAPDLADAS